MQTFVVEVLDDKAVPLLRDLENLAIIQLTLQRPEPVEAATLNQPAGRLSERFRGSISKEVAADLHRQLDDMRNEWISSTAPTSSGCSSARASPNPPSAPVGNPP